MFRYFWYSSSNKFYLIRCILRNSVTCFLFFPFIIVCIYIYYLCSVVVVCMFMYQFILSLNIYVCFI
jgi:hypothetical protein